MFRNLRFPVLYSYISIVAVDTVNISALENYW